VLHSLAEIARNFPQTDRNVQEMATFTPLTLATTAAPIQVNADQIRSLEPKARGTQITYSNGDRVMVQEDIDTVIEGTFG
jgi:hypothetical protein